MITPREGVVIAGRYTLVRPLAHGGMGSVWIARHRDLEIDVTVKFMAPALVASVEARTRFEREARAAARLKSQHVVHVHDYGVENDTPYIAMELLQGESLWTRLSREGRLPLSSVARLVVQVSKALRTAHEAGLVHRDLKPGNIFLARKDDDEVVTVLDFGIAKASSIGDAQAHTESGVLLGSVHYMSPEQARGSRTVDQRSDLWSVGVILYRMLTGRLPFPGENFGDVLVRVCTDPYPPPTMVAPDLPAWLDEFFKLALARDPDKRFQSATELANAFSTMALNAGAQPASSSPSPTSPPPAVKTIPMGRPVQAQPEVDGGTNELSTQKMVERRPPLRRDSGADEPTLAVRPEVDSDAGVRRSSEAGSGPIPAVLVGPRVTLSSGVERAQAGGGQGTPRSWRLVGAMAVVVVLVGILGVKLSSTATTSNGAESASASAAAVEAPSAMAPSATAPPATAPSITSPILAPSVSAGPVEAAPPATSSPVTPAPQKAARNVGMSGPRAQPPVEPAPLLKAAPPPSAPPPAVPPPAAKHPGVL